MVLARIFQKSTVSIHESLAYFSNFQTMLGRQLLLSLFAYNQVQHRDFSSQTKSIFA
jgi:hypothetical protein